MNLFNKLPQLELIIHFYDGSKPLSEFKGNYSNSSIKRHLNSLIKKGLIEFQSIEWYSLTSRGKDLYYSLLRLIP